MNAMRIYRKGISYNYHKFLSKLVSRRQYISSYVSLEEVGRERLVLNQPPLLLYLSTNHANNRLPTSAMAMQN